MASNRFGQPITVEILPFEKFWEAEGYHQDYHEKSPFTVQGVSNRFRSGSFPRKSMGR